MNRNIFIFTIFLLIFICFALQINIKTGIVNLVELDNELELKEANELKEYKCFGSIPYFDFQHTTSSLANYSNAEYVVSWRLTANAPSYAASWKELIHSPPVT